MLKKFSLYGLLKNQQYYEPFFLLALIQMGLNYTQIGFLIAFRELMINLLEIPSGAIADIWGKRKSMILSFVAYILYFIIIGTSGVLLSKNILSLQSVLFLLFCSMIFFAMGDAFRTGTHKSMIFTWLKLNKMTHKKTQIYGYTRSWSKIGSAISVLIASLFVYFTKNYIYIFFLSIIPYILNIINFKGYPKELDEECKNRLNIRDLFKHMKKTFINILHQKKLRRLVLESMGFEGFFKASKDYLQPILVQASTPFLALFFSHLSLTKEQKSIILIAPIYFLIFLLSAFASKFSHKLVQHKGNELNASRFIWQKLLILMLILTPAMYFNFYWLIILSFILFYILQNLWRPLLISRFNSESDTSSTATLLSIESQSKSISTMIIAPILGIIIDFTKAHDIGFGYFWSLGIIGAGIATFFYLTSNKNNRPFKTL